MKNIIYIWFISIIGILLGGVLLCIPGVIPFAITLLGLSAVLFVVTGILSILVICNCFENK